MELNVTKRERCRQCIRVDLQERIEEKREELCFRTAANYQSTYNKINSYQQTIGKELYLEELTSDDVKGFISYLNHLHKDKPQTVDFYIRTFRAMCNKALETRSGKWFKLQNPFSCVRIKKMKQTKRALNKNDVQKLLMANKCLQLSDSMKESLDILHFILYTRGMVFQDVYDLQKDMFIDVNHIQYYRSKTGQLINVEVVPEALRIAERYNDDSSIYVFPNLRADKKQLNKEVKEETALRRINSHGLKIGKALDLPIPLTTYVLRHSWATLMLEAGKSVEVISQCLGHSSIQTTQIYLSSISVNRIDAEVNDMFNTLIR